MPRDPQVQLRPVTSIGGVTVEMSSPVIHYVAGCAIDADGAPRCYHPADWGPRAEWLPAGRKPLGLDAPENGGKARREPDGTWVVTDSWGWATDDGSRTGRPVIQGAGDPAPGYYVSKTTLRDASLAPTDPRSYVDAAKVRYVAVPRRLLDDPFGVRMGDLAMVTYRGRRSFAIVADVGGNSHIGEGSIALCQALEARGSARDGGIAAGVSVHLFCGTARTFRFAPFYRDQVNEEVEAAGMQVASQYGVLSP